MTRQQVKFKDRIYSGFSALYESATFHAMQVCTFDDDHLEDMVMILKTLTNVYTNIPDLRHPNYIR